MDDEVVKRNELGRHSTMKELKVFFYKKQDSKSERTVTMPLSALHVSIQLMPKKIISALDKEEINLMKCVSLTEEKDTKGTLIEVENSNEKIVISVA